MVTPAYTDPSTGITYHWVTGSNRQEGYWRKLPWTYKHPSQRQADNQNTFATIAHEKGTDALGTNIDYDTGIVIPNSALELKAMKGYHPPGEPRRPYQMARVSTQSTLIILKQLSERLESEIRKISA